MKRRYDYDELAKLEPEVSKFLKNTTQYEYDDPDAVRALNRALLKAEYNLQVNLPAGHLCPTVENRSRYIALFEKLIYRLFKYQPENPVIGIDIGTGTSCIYPLIGCARNPSWEFIATDIDENILNYAKANIETNNLSERIILLHNLDPNVIFPPELVDKLSSILPHFVMCNPPFYSSSQEMEEKRQNKYHAPFASENEIYTSEAIHADGGEVGFVKKMIAESRTLAHKIELFSCMLGVKDSLDELIDYFKHQTGVSFAFEVIKVSHTSRWILLWSYCKQFQTEPNCKLKTNTMQMGVQTIDCNLTRQEIINELLKYGNLSDTLKLRITENRWSRKARRSHPEPLLVEISIQVVLEDDQVIFELLSGEWDTFVGFVNHLRKSWSK